MRKINVMKQKDRASEWVIDYQGLFHKWFIDSNGDTYAIVEKNNGNIDVVYYKQLRFTGDTVAL